MGVLYVVSTQPFVSWSMMQIPSPTLWVGFSLFYWGLLWTRVLNFNIILWFILSFNGLCFFVCVLLKKIFHYCKHDDMLLLFSGRFVDVPCTFRSTMYLKLIFVCCVKLFSFFPCRSLFDLTPFIEKTVLPFAI